MSATTARTILPSTVDDSVDVPIGYKPTEVGVIPEEWDVNTVASTTSRYARHAIVDGPFGSNLKTIHYRTSGVPIITSGYVTDGVFRADEYLYVDKDKFKQEIRSAVSPGDIVMAKIGARCGATAILPEWHTIGILSGNALKITVDESRHSTCFIWQLLWSLYSNGDIEAWKSIGAQPAISMPSLKKHLLPLPPLSEQRSIAEALSDVDGLIKALDKLIAKKRAIKQAAMQQLLTGKTRLPGFREEWGTTCLGEVAHIKNGATPRTQIAAYWNGDFPWCTPTDITGTAGKYLRATERRITAEGLASCAASLLPAGALLLCSRATIGEIKIAASPICTNQGFKSLVCKTGVSNEFLYYLLLTLKPQMIERAIGSTFLEIGKCELASIHMELPEYGEQKAIATVLSDMDAEIAALERRRDKTKQIKQGTMQQLLTGRIRLVKPNATAVETEAAAQEKKGHNWQFNEAVVISVLTKQFSDAEHPLGRKRYTKLSYLLHRHAKGRAEGYLKKAAGPYNPRTKYGGPEKIALENSYVRKHTSGKFRGFITGDNSAQAEGYFDKWYDAGDRQWLQQFRYQKNDDLELLTTVDMAVEELRASNAEATVDSVKTVILANKEWKAKLSRDVFSDDGIARAIEECQTLFGRPEGPVA